ALQEPPQLKAPLDAGKAEMQVVDVERARVARREAQADARVHHAAALLERQGEIDVVDARDRKAAEDGVAVPAPPAGHVREVRDVPVAEGLSEELDLVAVDPVAV